MTIVQLSDDFPVPINTVVTSKAFDLTSVMGAAFNIVVTGPGATGTVKLQGCVKDDKWFDLPSSTTAPTTIAIAVGSNLYLNTGYVAFYGLVRVHVTEANTAAITNVEVRGTGKA